MKGFLLYEAEEEILLIFDPKHAPKDIEAIICK